MVYFDLLVITDRVRGGKSDVHDMLLALGARGVWSWSYPGGRRREDPLGLWPSAWQELDCVLDYLAEISNQEVNPADEMPPHLQKLPTLSFESLSTLMKVPSEDFTAVMQGQWHPELAATSPGYHFFHVHQAYRQRGLCAIVGLDFKPFRRLGLGIWDREKLRRLGLCNYPDKKVENYEELYVNSTYTKWEMFLRWRSLVVEGDFQS